MNSEQLELVTAYVDGEATEDERARVEADADLLAEVERQRAARAAVHDVEPPSAAGRDAAIAAALAVFDDEIAPTIRPAHPAAIPARDVTVPTNIVPFDQRRRTRWMQSLGAAAAVAAVVVAGAVVATRGGGDDDGSTADVRENPPLSVVDTLAEDEAAQAPRRGRGRHDRGRRADGRRGDRRIGPGRRRRGRRRSGQRVRRKRGHDGVRRGRPGGRAPDTGRPGRRAGNDRGRRPCGRDRHRGRSARVRRRR